jgi:hypothetical protein
MSDQEINDVPTKSPARSRSAKSPASKSAKSPAAKSSKSPARKSAKSPAPKPAKTVTKSKVTKDPAATKAAPTHPKYSEMVATSIKAIAARGGCSRQAILKKIKEDFDVGDNDKRVALNLNMTLKKGIESGRLKMAREKGKGAGSYKLGELPKAEKKPVKRLAEDKSKAKKKVATKVNNGKTLVKKSVTAKSKEKASAKRKSIGALATKKKLKAVTPSKKKTPVKDGKAVAKKTPSKASKPLKKTPVKAAAKKGSTAKPTKPSETKKKTLKKTK